MWYEVLLKNNLVPDALIRMGIRGQLKQKIKQIEAPGLSTTFIRRIRQSPIAVHTDIANQQHYELPPEFFEIVLGNHLKYSSGLWPDEVSDLSIAEEIMLELYCKRAELSDGQSMLDLGCGWGSLTLYLAKKYPHSQVVGVSNSQSQKNLIEERAKSLGLSNVSIITGDMNTLELKERFDRVLSIEMFEHMRNYIKLFHKVANWMKEDAKLFVHVFCHREHAYLFETEDDSNWMAKYFFTGGLMPSQSLFSEFKEDLEVKEQWSVSGKHYEKTCNAWLSRMDTNKKKIMSIFESTYGKNDSRKWWAYWRVFFMACAELFGYRDGKEWFVSHYLFERVNIKEQVPQPTI